MTNPGRLSEAEIVAWATRLEGWAVEDGKLRRVFEFDSFPEAFGFMAAAAIHAQQMDHHPDWSNSYRTVVVTLTSHDVGGLSERDFRLAEIMDGLSAKRTP